MQKIINGYGSAGQMQPVLESLQCRKFMLVCGGSFDHSGLKGVFEGLDVPYVRFSDFSPNPQYAQVEKGVALFNRENCDALVAVGGGSALDVAKCIKLFCKMQQGENYLQQTYADTGIPLVAIPTTAGTGSESTRFAVIYYQGAKQSVAHDSILPDVAILDPVVLKTLPLYQKKCTMLDALCQAVESWWSVNSTDQSKEYAKKAISLLLGNYQAFFYENDQKAAEKVLEGANFAGRSINITQTTAAHAMSYKMTSLFGIPHGHAVAVGLPVIFDYMIDYPENCIDNRGQAYLEKTFLEIAESFGKKTPKAAVAFFNDLLTQLEIQRPNIAPEQLAVLASSVNPTRLKNNPVQLTEQTIYRLYEKIGGNISEA